MHSAFVTINQVPTRVTTWGKWIEEDFQADEPKDLIIFMPGNPGYIKFYYEFLKTLHEQLGYPVWVVGHAGHDKPENESLQRIPSFKRCPELFNLEGQIQHKVEFMEKYVPPNARVHLIGHSVGTYIITKLLKIPSIRNRVVNNYFLFPTLEYIADTPNGKFYTGLIEKIMFITLFLVWFFTLLPRFIQVFLIHIYMFVTGTKHQQLDNIIGLIDPKILKQVFSMASDEMVHLRERETDVIKANVNSIRVYFGASDGWAPVSYCKKLQDDIPNIRAEVCKRNFNHAFCLSSSKEVAMVVVDWFRG